MIEKCPSLRPRTKYQPKPSHQVITCILLWTNFWSKTIELSAMTNNGSQESVKLRESRALICAHLPPGGQVKIATLNIATGCQSLDKAALFSDSSVKQTETDAPQTIFPQFPPTYHLISVAGSWLGFCVPARVASEGNKNQTNLLGRGQCSQGFSSHVF